MCLFLFQSDKVQCPICEKWSSGKYNLKRHMMIHEGQYRYKCQHCDRGFATKMRQLEHLTTHTNQFYFKCEVCGMNFPKYNALQKHRHEQGH